MNVALKDHQRRPDACINNSISTMYGNAEVMALCMAAMVTSYCISVMIFDVYVTNFV